MKINLNWKPTLEACPECGDEHNGKKVSGVANTFLAMFEGRIPVTGPAPHAPINFEDFTDEQKERARKAAEELGF